MAHSPPDPISLAASLDGYARDQSSYGERGDQVIKNALQKVIVMSESRPVCLRLAFNQYLIDTPYSERENKLVDLENAVALLYEITTKLSNFHMSEDTTQDIEPARRPDESDIRYALRREQWRIATGREKIVQLEDTDEMKRIIEHARRLAETSPG